MATMEPIPGTSKVPNVPPSAWTAPAPVESAIAETARATSDERSAVRRAWRDMTGSFRAELGGWRAMVEGAPLAPASGGRGARVHGRLRGQRHRGEEGLEGGAIDEAVE